LSLDTSGSAPSIAVVKPEAITSSILTTTKRRPNLSDALPLRRVQKPLLPIPPLLHRYVREKDPPKPHWRLDQAADFVYGVIRTLRLQFR
jgi:hypothetical protein